MPIETAFADWIPALRAAFFLLLWIAPLGVALFAAPRLLRPLPMSVRLIRQIAPWALALEVLRLLAVAWLWLNAESPQIEFARFGLVQPGLVLGAASLVSLLLFGLAVHAGVRRRSGAAGVCICLCGLVDLLLLCGLATLWGGQLLGGGQAVRLPFFRYMLVWLVLLAPAAGLAFAQLRVLARRAKDDFGRDYYAFALRACAGAAGVSAFLAVIPLIVVLVRRAMECAAAPDAGTGVPIQLVSMAVGVLLCLLVGIVWISVRRSKAPLRRKLSLVCTPVPLFVGMVCVCFGFLK